MKLHIHLLLTIFILLSAASAVAQTVTFFPASAPVETTANAEWRANAANALKNEALTWGTLGTPGYFDASDSTILVSEVVRTPTFSSWNGYANPSAVFGSAFASQIGNSYRVPFIVMRGETQFSMSQLTATSVMSGSVTNSSSLPLMTGNYISTLIGINYGANATFGGSDDVFITSGANTQLVDAFIYNAAGHTFTVSPLGLGEQERLNNTFSTLAGLTITTTVFLDGVEVGQHVQTFGAVAPIPEPWHYALIFGVAAFCCGFVKWCNQTPIGRIRV